MAKKKSEDTSEETLGAEDSMLGTAHEPAPEPEMSAADRLRAFEDEKLGADVTRWDGKVERGHGSLHGRMSDEDKAIHAQLEAEAANGQ